jgi:general secretion pathway protein G
MVMNAKRRARAGQAGFTLIELVVVVTIVGILAGIALVNVRGAQRKAAENVLRANLTNMRKAIDDFYADKQRYPASLQELVDAKYIRSLPKDPITKSETTWIEITEQPDATDSFDFSSTWSPGGDNDFQQPGIIDLKSGAEGQTLDGTPYGEL